MTTAYLTDPLLSVGLDKQVLCHIDTKHNPIHILRQASHVWIMEYNQQMNHNWEFIECRKLLIHFVYH